MSEQFIIQTTISANSEDELDKRISDLVKRGWVEVRRGYHSEEKTTLRKTKHWARMKQTRIGR